ncbi:MAG: hypothetical protein P8M25_08645 [Paracoccaceae bacterium]|nr:hypothetical protein [Paracoccaceae bacterium]
MNEDLLTIYRGLSIVSIIALAVLTLISPEVPEGSAGFVLRGWVSTMGPTLPWIFLQAIGSIFGIGLIIRVYQLGQASYVAVYEYSVFIFGPFFDDLLARALTCSTYLSHLPLLSGDDEP